jgi:hypothetical protein
MLLDPRQKHIVFYLEDLNGIQKILAMKDKYLWLDSTP